MLPLEQMARSLMAKLPRGPLWRSEPESIQRQILDGIAEGLLRLYGETLGLVDEEDPLTTVRLLAEWERLLGLPGACADLPDTIQERRAAVVQRVNALGGSSAAYFIDLAAALGFEDVTISEFNPFRVGDPVGGALAGDAAEFAWQVNSPEAVAITSFRVGQSAVGEPLRSWGNELLECTFELLKPAHTTVIFAYGSM